MLYHLKEPDYKRKEVTGFPTHIYGRSETDILTFLDYYKGRARNEGLTGDPELYWWIKNRFGTKDIETVESGYFGFITGMLSIREEDKDKPLCEEIKVCDDFFLYIPKDNIGNFIIWRQCIMDFERGGLYKLESPALFLKSMSFVPRDIAEKIKDLDLTPYKRDVQRDMKTREELSQHPNLQVNGLQQLLEGKPKTIILSNQN